MCLVLKIEEINLAESIEDLEKARKSIHAAVEKAYQEKIRLFKERDGESHENRSDDVNLCGVIHQYGMDNYGLWEGFVLSDEDEAAIYEILKKYDTEGCAVCGTKKDIAKEILATFGMIEKIGNAMAQKLSVVNMAKRAGIYKDNFRECPSYSEFEGMAQLLKNLEIDCSYDYVTDSDCTQITAITIEGQIFKIKH